MWIFILINNIQFKVGGQNVKRKILIEYLSIHDKEMGKILLVIMYVNDYIREESIFHQKDLMEVITLIRNKSKTGTYFQIKLQYTGIL